MRSKEVSDSDSDANTAAWNASHDELLRWKAVTVYDSEHKVTRGLTGSVSRDTWRVGYLERKFERVACHFCS